MQYCPTHETKHGLVPQSRPGMVPSHLTGLYEEFLTEDRPFDLSREMAAMRTLYRELGRMMEEGVSHEHLTSRLCEVLHRNCGVEPNDAYHHIMHTLKRELPIFPSSLSSIKEMSAMLERIARVAEKMRRIQEGVKLKVDIDVNIISWFIREVIFPVISDPLQRMQIAEKARAFSSHLFPAVTPQDHLPLSRTEEEPDILQRLRKGED